MQEALAEIPGGGKAKGLLDQMRDTLRLKQYSLRTERTYCDWVERFVRFHARRGLVEGATEEAQAGRPRYVWRHPREMGEAEVSEFLTHLARDGKVSAATQNQAA